jgi:hypothetical protein
MKTSLIILFTILINSVFAQQDPYYNSIQFTLLNSKQEQILNAKLFVDGIEIPYKSEYHSYYKNEKFNSLFDLVVICDGYDTLRYNTFNLYGSGDRDFRTNLYLIKPTDKYYYADRWFKIPYESHPNKLLVVLKSERYPKRDSLIFEFEKELQKNGLKISKTFTERPTDPAQEWKYRSYAGIQDRVIIQKQDETDFKSDFSNELAFLRYLDMVQYAGPFIINGISEYDVITYTNSIQIRHPLRYYKSDDIHSFLQQIDKRFYFDEKLHSIILPPETNEIVPEIMEKLKALGFKEEMSMSILHNVMLD